MNDYDIDEWEDMLPEERKYEKQHSFSGSGFRGKDTGIGGFIIWLLVMIYIIVDAFQ